VKVTADNTKNCRKAYGVPGGIFVKAKAVFVVFQLPRQLTKGPIVVRLVDDLTVPLIIRRHMDRPIDQPKRKNLLTNDLIVDD
jgi:hypothetical protein